MIRDLKLAAQFLGSKLTPVIGPDARRYLLMAEGERVVMPFQLRWLWPGVCGTDMVLWWIVWLMSFPVALGGMVWWGMAEHGWQVAVAAGVMLVALPGFLGVRPVEVALPSMALGVMSAAAFANGQTFIGVVLAVIAATSRESMPIWIALWVWNPWALIALVAPAIRWLLHRPAMDEVTAGQTVLRQVHDLPILSALQHQQGRWRDGWMVVVPWGVTIAALYRPSWQLGVLLVITYAQLLITTDYARLLQSAAGPAMALAAASVIPVEWLVLAVVVHVVWWRQPVMKF